MIRSHSAVNVSAASRPAVAVPAPLSPIALAKPSRSPSTNRRTGAAQQPVAQPGGSDHYCLRSWPATWSELQVGEIRFACIVDNRRLDAVGSGSNPFSCEGGKKAARTSRFGSIVMCPSESDLIVSRCSESRASAIALPGGCNRSISRTLTRRHFDPLRSAASRHTSQSQPPRRSGLCSTESSPACPERRCLCAGLEKVQGTPNRGTPSRAVTVPPLLEKLAALCQSRVEAPELPRPRRSIAIAPIVRGH